MCKRPTAFSLMEMLAAMAIAAVLLAVGLGAGSRALGEADKSDSVAHLRSLGQAASLYAGEHDQRLPGPLWPGQVMLYDADRDGRLVRDLAGYLGIEQQAAPYLVTRMIPRAYRRNMPPGRPEDARIYVMNSSIVMNGQTNAPFGSLTASPIVPSMRISQLDKVPENERWMISEADQVHPDVVSAPWKANTLAAPVHAGRRARLGFDGSVTFEKPAP